MPGRASQHHLWGTIRADHSLDVLSENVELKIYEVADGCTIKVGVKLGIRDNPDSETSRKNFRNGETNSIDRDRTLANHITRKEPWQFDFQAEVNTLNVEGCDWCYAVHMALNEMSA